MSNWIDDHKLVITHANELLVYLGAIPPTVPRGTVLVHNHVLPTPDLGVRGFRAWLEIPSDRVEQCDCDWLWQAGSEISEHYRIRRNGEAS